VVDAVIFDLDGVLIESEHLWDAARRALVTETGGIWLPEATSAMQGMSSPEWSAYLRDRLGVPREATDISEGVVERLLTFYRQELPVIPGAFGALERLGRRWPLGLASSSNRAVIDTVLELTGLEGSFAVTVSSEEVRRGKPSPDVYLETARRLAVAPTACIAVEDSANGVRSALSARMSVVLIPNRQYGPPADVIAGATVVLESIDGLDVETIERATSG
jgi:HAD superfamily hydrolase (TIGR01509 family)